MLSYIPELITELYMNKTKKNDVLYNIFNTLYSSSGNINMNIFTLIKTNNIGTALLHFFNQLKLDKPYFTYNIQETEICLDVIGMIPPKVNSIKEEFLININIDDSKLSRLQEYINKLSNMEDRYDPSCSALGMHIETKYNIRENTNYILLNINNNNKYNVKISYTINLGNNVFILYGIVYSTTDKGCMECDFIKVNSEENGIHYTKTFTYDIPNKVLDEINIKIKKSYLLVYKKISKEEKAMLDSNAITKAAREVALISFTALGREQLTQPLISSLPSSLLSLLPSSLLPSSQPPPQQPQPPQQQPLQ